MSEQEKSPGQICYEGRYAGCIRKHSPDFRKGEARAWEDVPKVQQDKWQQAALAVLGYADYEIVPVFRKRP